MAVKLSAGARQQILAAAKKRGAAATHIAHVALYGTRHTPDTNAGTATPARAGVGVGLHSVWQGPKQIKGGAPVLKRSRSG